MVEPVEIPLYRWPQAAKFGRVVPKTKLYEKGQVPTNIREKFVAEVQRISWAYKLAESTINLPGSTAVPEIQVFQIDAKGNDVSDSVLSTIDKTVRTPIIFEISRGEGALRRTRMAATYKQVGVGTAKLGTYYTTSWHSDETARQPLPTTINLAGLYAALLEPLTPVTTCPGEEMSEVVARLATVRTFEREIAALERKLRTEPQLNRKVDLRRAIKFRQATLAKMTSPTPNPATGTKN